MRHIESLVEAYLTAERDLVAAVDAADGAVPLPDGRIVTVGRAEFDALLGERRKRAWVLIRKNPRCRGDVDCANKWTCSAVCASTRGNTSAPLGGGAR
jgi:hypothetical protein